eukprot:11457252-Alexandrium_andersonii.AAC.1
MPRVAEVPVDVASKGTVVQWIDIELRPPASLGSEALQFDLNLRAFLIAPRFDRSLQCPFEL